MCAIVHVMMCVLYDVCVCEFVCGEGSCVELWTLDNNAISNVSLMCMSVLTYNIIVCV